MEARDYVIRDMSEEDITSILEISKKLIKENASLTYSDRKYALGGEMQLSKIAEYDGQLIGFVLGKMQWQPRFLAEVATIIGIGIAPEHQHKGVAQMLVKGFVEGCRSKGVQSVRTLINIHDKTMTRFLQKSGFAQNDIVEFIFGPMGINQ